MGNRNLTFRQKIVAGVGAVLLPAVMIFGCKVPATPDEIKELPLKVCVTKQIGVRFSPPGSETPGKILRVLISRSALPYEGDGKPFDLYVGQTRSGVTLSSITDLIQPRDHIDAPLVANPTPSIGFTSNSRSFQTRVPLCETTPP